MASLETARRMMVDGQIRPNDVTDLGIIAAFGAVPRERFVPDGQAAIAYLDRDVTVGKGRAILKAMTLAKLIQAADIRDGARVLDVGCATGYSSAVLATMGADVVALEQDEACAAIASRELLALGLAVTLRRGPLVDGAKADAPFDVILMNGAVDRVPRALLSQLKEGGRLVCIQRHAGNTRAMLYVSADGDAGGRPLFDASAPALPGFADAPEFTL